MTQRFKFFGPASPIDDFVVPPLGALGQAWRLVRAVITWRAGEQGATNNYCHPHLIQRDGERNVVWEAVGADVVFEPLVEVRSHFEALAVPTVNQVTPGALMSDVLVVVPIPASVVFQPNDTLTVSLPGASDNGTGGDGVDVPEIFQSIFLEVEFV